MELINETIKTSDIEKWVKELRSGNYSQTRTILQDVDGFCCLGVACSIFIPEDKQIKFNGVLQGGYPRDQQFAPEWLRRIDQDFKTKVGLFLSTLNDDGIGNFYRDTLDIEVTERLSFDEIADLLEAVYIHKVL